MQVDDVLNLHKVQSQQHYTKPPPRYSEGSLVSAVYYKIGLILVVFPISFVSLICKVGFSVYLMLPTFHCLYSYEGEKARRTWNWKTINLRVYN